MTDNLFFIYKDRQRRVANKYKLNRIMNSSICLMKGEAMSGNAI